MAKTNAHIEIVRTKIKTLSSLSQESCDAIVAVLSKHFTQVGVTIVNDLPALDALVESGPDLVFLGMEFIPTNPAVAPEDSNYLWVSDYLDQNNIAYTGSNQAAHELERNKHLAKQRVLDADLATAAYRVIKRTQTFDATNMPLAFPLFVKPTNRGGGAGIDKDSVVRSAAELQSKVRTISSELQSDSLVEEYLSGREFSVAVLKDKHTDGYLALPLELIAPLNSGGSRLLSSHVKSSNTERAIGIVDKATKRSVSKLALDVFHALGARDYGRIDVRMDAAGVPHFLEANLIPSLIRGYGSFPKACVLNLGLEYEQMILRIVELGLARSTTDEDAYETLADNLTPYPSPILG